MNRRNLLTGLGAAAAALVGAACAQTPAAARITGQSAAAAPASHQAMSPPPVPATGDASHMTAMGANPQMLALAKSHEMDQHHESGLKAFPAKTAKHGNQRLEPTVVDGVKVFDVSAA